MEREKFLSKKAQKQIKILDDIQIAAIGAQHVLFYKHVKIPESIEDLTKLIKKLKKLES